MSKKSKHPRICKLCQKGIGGNEHYCRLTEFNEGNEISTGFYHVTCFKERFMNFAKLQTDANNVLSMAKQAMGKMGVTQ